MSNQCRIRWRTRSSGVAGTALPRFRHCRVFRLPVCVSGRLCIGRKFFAVMNRTPTSICALPFKHTSWSLPPRPPRPSESVGGPTRSSCRRTKGSAEVNGADRLGRPPVSRRFTAHRRCPVGSRGTVMSLDGRCRRGRPQSRRCGRPDPGASGRIAAGEGRGDSDDRRDFAKSLKRLEDQADSLRKLVGSARD